MIRHQWSKGKEFLYGRVYKKAPRFGELFLLVAGIYEPLRPVLNYPILQFAGAGQTMYGSLMHSSPFQTP